MKAKTVPSGSPKRSSPKGRPGGLTRLHKTQRAETRKTIIEAARALFFERSYAASTVDSIRHRAGVSKSSFYRHFTDKWEVAKIIFAEFPPESKAYWSSLATLRDPTLKVTANWLRGFLKYLENNIAFIKLLSEIEAVEPQSIDIYVANMSERLALMAKEDPAFEKVARESKSEERYFVELFFFQLDRFTYMALARGWHSKNEESIHAMARHIQAFLGSQRSAYNKPQSGY